MISIVVCSRNRDIPEALKQNIRITIGVEYELIVIDNSQNKYSIFSAYNEGVFLAKYPYLCFMHEDILFHTQNWGEKTLKHFNDEKVGLIGVVGGHYLPKCPASWWSTECRSGQILQGMMSDENQQYKTQLFEWHRNKKQESNSVEVVSVDGLWFCIPKYLFEKIKFDNNTFSGFHSYDTDICLQIIKNKFSVNVAFDILIEHQSYGNQNEQFVKQREKLYYKWERYLPITKGIELTKNEIYDRCELVKEVNNELNRRIIVQKELIQARSSCAYKLGHLLLKPLSLIRKIK